MEQYIDISIEFEKRMHNLMLFYYNNKNILRAEYPLEYYIELNKYRNNIRKLLSINLSTTNYQLIYNDIQSILFRLDNV